MDHVTTEQPPALFDVPELAPLPNARRAEAGLAKALAAAAEAQLVQDVDAALVGAAFVAARALDRAEGLRDDKAAVYAIAQATPPYQSLLHALGLPVQRAPVAAPPVSAPTEPSSGVPDWLGEQLGPQ